MRFRYYTMKSYFKALWARITSELAEIFTITNNLPKKGTKKGK